MKKNEKFENFCHMVFNRPRRLKFSGLTTSASAVKAGKLICRPGRPGRFLLAYLLAATVLVLLSASGAWADENYTSFNSNYPDRFDNDGYDSRYNEVVEMDAVNFKGYEFIFFTLRSDVGDNGSYLYWHIPGTDYRGKVDIHNSVDLNFRIKTCVFKDILYIFYTTSYSGDTHHPNTNIYYRTLNIESDTTGMVPAFSDEKSYAAGVSPATILFAAEMNEKLYVMFSSNKDWYVTSSSVHGATFAPKANIYTALEGLYGPGGTVFPVLDAEGEMVDRMMVAYCTKNDTGYIKTWFFDGERAYGGHNVSTPGIYARAVRLFAGGADGYNNSSFSIQIFISAPEDDSKRWASLYHNEYIPSGINGDAGSWSSSWTYLQNSNDDNPHCFNDYGSDCWSVIPVYTEEDNILRTSLRIWYGKGTNWIYLGGVDGPMDELKFRASTYKSDLLEHVGDTQITEPYELDDLSLAFVVGILEGTPPFPVNNGDLGDVNTNTSALTLGTSTNTDVSTAWTASTSVGRTSIGQTLKDKFTSVLKRTYSDTTSSSASVQYTFKTYTNEPPGNYGWAMVFRPEIIVDQYVLKSYDGEHTLTYGGDTSNDETYFYLILYGPNSDIVPMPYYLQDPSGDINGNPYTEIFAGMKERPLDSNIDGWVNVTQEYTRPNQFFSYNTLPMASALSCTLGEVTSVALSMGETPGVTSSTSNSLTVKANKLGFNNVGVEENISWSSDFSSKTTITDNLGFWLNIPECCYSQDPDCTTSCIASVDDMPIMLTPADDDTGYDAPWISDDIRNNKKPKPWCLSYLVYPQIGDGDDMERLTIDKASATLHLDPNHANRDRMSAKLRLKGLAQDFSLKDLERLHFRIGSHVINSDSNPILSRDVKGKKLFLEFTEAANPDASIRLILSYNKARSLLTINVKGNRLDLADFSHLLRYAGEFGGEPDTVPFVLFLGGDHSASGDLNVRLW